MKKLINLLFVALFAIAVSVSLVNADTKGTFDTTNGKITINNAVNGETYDAYRILDLESYDTTLGAYSYKAASDWNEFLTTGEGKNYVTFNAEGYVTSLNNAAEFAAKAIAYAKANNMTANASATAANKTAVMTGLNLGYYLVDSSVGVLCNLNTTNNEVTISEKNSTPVIEKEVTETTATIGQEVHYEITLNNVANIKNVKVTDTLSAGLTSNENVVVTNNGKEFTDYTIKYEGQTFTLVITNTEALGEVVITYSATVNEKAVTNVANTNTATLTYGNNQEVTTDPTKTYTYGFKFHKVNGNKEALNGAEFKLYDAAGNEVKLVEVTTTAGKAYRVALANETAVEVIEAGLVQIDGLAAGTYYLEETKAPEGYNKLATRVEITVLAGNEEATYNYGDTEVVNTTGTLLPSTGGIGTTLFVMVGSILVVAFGLSLITKFRMSKEY